jgi:hypothetical protein
MGFGDDRFSGPSWEPRIPHSLHPGYAAEQSTGDTDS